MKLASFLFALGLLSAAVFFLSPVFAYAKESKNTVQVGATVLEHLTYYKNDNKLEAATNTKNGYWVIDNTIVVSRY